MNLIHVLLSKTIAKLKGSKVLQNMMEKPIPLGKLSQMGVFVDSNNKSHILYDNLRNIIKPGASKSVSLKTVVKDRAYHLHRLKAAKSDIASISGLINAAGKQVKDATILEVGCDIGYLCYALAKDGAAQVQGVDTTVYKSSATSLTQELFQSNLDHERKNIQNIVQVNNVSFKEDDICNSALPSNYFDIILSFDVLEHVSDPQKAFIQIQRILKPGGIAVHKYNPFFSINGGHSACTLDFLWGHVRLNDEDFVKYIQQVRPQEQTSAEAFFFHGLNRMSLSDTKEFSVNAGLDLLGCIQMAKKQTLKMLNANILKECKHNYKNISIEDLTTVNVIIVQKKPE
ncbi:MAG: class I SAM-dependent methyltransferase [Bacteroidales bacterium]|jgi:SAM-dependent methyltransferase|nr:class I SAM-dependent methyltransferase [Bacteroidales bacterium]